MTANTFSEGAAARPFESDWTWGRIRGKNGRMTAGSRLESALAIATETV